MKEQKMLMLASGYHPVLYKSVEIDKSYAHGLRQTAKQMIYLKRQKNKTD